MSICFVGGHRLEFADPIEVGQGGPVTCALRIDGRVVSQQILGGLIVKNPRFHPSPLVYAENILLPQRKGIKFFLVRIDPQTLDINTLSKGYAYMNLLSVEASDVVFSARGDGTEIQRIRLPRF